MTETRKEGVRSKEVQDKLEGNNKKEEDWALVNSSVDFQHKRKSLLLKQHLVELF